MSLLCAKGRYAKNLQNKHALEIANLQNDHQEQLRHFQKQLQNVQNQLGHYSTKSDIENIKSEFEQKCEQIKTVSDSDVKKVKFLKENPKKRKKIVKEVKVESESEESDSEEEKKPEKKPKKVSINSAAHVCSQCFQVVNAVDAVHGLCRNCIIQQKAILCNPYFIKNKSGEGKKKDKKANKKLIELGYTRALKDVKNKKLPFKKNGSDSDDD